MRARPLLYALKSFLDEALAGFSLPDPATGGAAFGQAVCFFGNIPDDDTASMPERFPFVVIRWLKGEDNEEGESQEEAALIFGIYSPEGAGEAELVTAALLDHMRQALMRRRLLDETFDLILPLESSKPDGEHRQHHYHIATIITRWSHRVPRRPLTQGEFDD